MFKIVFILKNFLRKVAQLIRSYLQSFDLDFDAVRDSNHYPTKDHKLNFIQNEGFEKSSNSPQLNHRYAFPCIIFLSILLDSLVLLHQANYHYSSSAMSQLFAHKVFYPEL